LKSKAKPQKRGADATPRGGAARMLRIVGGTHRGRRWRFPADTSIRPTPDRVRETLFNWLAPRIAGARCLDAFAGSGALGLEALSRGASEVVFVERAPTVAAAISDVLRAWGEPGGRVITADTGRWLSAGAAAGTTDDRSAYPAERPGGAITPSAPFGIVFLDPPFDAGVLGETARVLSQGWLADDARIYIEHAADTPLPALPVGWQALKSGRAGAVGYHLYGFHVAS
jgi:16S rRNA (guanine966-N2)-methyltransferase